MYRVANHLIFDNSLKLSNQSSTQREIWKDFCTDNTLLFKVFLMVICVLGTVYQISYFAYTLFVIISENELMVSFLASVLSQLHKISMAIFLFFIIEYWYVMWYFFGEFRGQYTLNE